MQLLSHASQARALHAYIISHQGNAQDRLHVCINLIESADCMAPDGGAACRGALMHGARSKAVLSEVSKACLWVKDPSRCTAGVLYCQVLHQAIQLLLFGLLAGQGDQAA